MANPYTSGGDVNPFADDLDNRASGQGAAAYEPPSQVGSPAAATGGDVVKSPAAEPPSFFDPQQQAPPASQFYDPPAAVGASTFSPSASGAGGPSPAAADDAAFSTPAGQTPPLPTEAGQPQPARDLQTAKFWTLAFFQQFFDVDTADVARRIGNAFVPFAPPDFLQGRDWHGAPSGAIGSRLGQASARISHSEHGEKTPDMYGPFWLNTTLWVAIGIVSNIVSKIDKIQRDEEYEFDFSTMVVAIAVFYSYNLLMSGLVWGLMKWKAVPAALLDVLCLYGYSSVTLLVAAVICGIPNPVVQWVTCSVAGVWSTMYLLLNFWRLWRTTLSTTWFISVVLLVAVFQIGMTLSLKFYFFNY